MAVVIVVIVVALERVGVVGVDVVAAEIDLRLEFEALAEQPAHPQTREEQVVGRAVGMREHLGAICFEQFHGHDAVADQLVVRDAQGELHVPALAALRELEKRLPQRAGREVAPAVLLERPRAGEPAEALPGAERAAGAQFTGAATERTGLDRQVDPLRIEPAPRGQSDRSAERVQAEHRVRPRYELDPFRRERRHEVPGHHVAEDLVDADAVLVDREALVRAQERRGAEAPVEHVGLERAPLGRREVYPGQLRLEQSAYAGNRREIERFRRNAMDRPGHTIG